MYLRLTILLFVLILLLQACKTNTLSNAEQNDSIDTSTDYNLPQILTLVLEFSTTEKEDEDKISLAHKVITPGTLKDEKLTLDALDRYQISILDNSGKEIKRFSIADPLRKKMEHSNEQGELSMDTVTIDQDAVPIRLNYSQELSNLKIYKRQENELNLILNLDI